MKLTTLEEVSTIDEEVEGVLLGELYALADDVVEVVGSQVVGHEVPKSCLCWLALSFCRKENGMHSFFSCGIIHVIVLTWSCRCWAAWK